MPRDAQDQMAAAAQRYADKGAPVETVPGPDYHGPEDAEELTIEELERLVEENKGKRGVGELRERLEAALAQEAAEAPENLDEVLDDIDDDEEVE